MIPKYWFEEAHHRLADYIRITPITYDADKDLYIKWENHQITGSFKIRGALNKVLTLQPWEREGGLVAASAGNHGLGVAFAGKTVGVPVTIFVPQNAVPIKIQAIRDLGASVEVVPGYYGDAEQAGLAYATTHKQIWISPYNDGQVITGQGTLGLEILNQRYELQSATWIIPVGGGGLIAGIGAVIKERNPQYGFKPACNKLIGVQSHSSPFFHAIFHSGSQQSIVELPSLADGLAGRVEGNSLTIPLARKFVDDLILISEDGIEEAIHYAWITYNERIEGSAAAALAPILSGQITDKPLVIIMSGGNIQPEVHNRIINN